MSIENTNLTILPTGYQLHWYKFKEVLGRGGFGITYLANDINLDQVVAIKEYFPKDIAVRHSGLSVQPVSEKYKAEYYTGLQRFTEEARTISKVEHPNFVRVLSVFEANNSSYIVMRYEKGQSLKCIRKTKKFSENEILNIVFPILDGLEILHNNNFIHRDIKPENLIIRDENNFPVLIDFGSARRAHGDSDRNLTCLISPGYAPIEQYLSNGKDDKQGAWTDIYGLSATLYYAITRIAPSPAINRGDSLLQTTKDTYVPVSLLAKDEYSKKLLKAIDRGLEFKQQDRPQSIAKWRTMFEPQKTSHQSVISSSIIQDDIETMPNGSDLNIENISKLSRENHWSGKAKHIFYSLLLIAALVLPIANITDVFSDKEEVKTIQQDFYNSRQGDGDRISRAHDFIENLRFTEVEHEKNITVPEVDSVNFREAVNTLVPRATDGQAFAQYNLGIIFFIRDIDESLKWYRMAAEQGYIRAQKQLGFIYYNGLRVAENDEEAFKWYSLAAVQGDAEAQFMLGTMYMSGEGINKDVDKARDWLYMAGDRGYESARETLKQIEKKKQLVNNS